MSAPVFPSIDDIYCIKSAKLKLKLKLKRDLTQFLTLFSSCLQVDIDVKRTRYGIREHVTLEPLILRPNNCFSVKNEIKFENEPILIDTPKASKCPIHFCFRPVLRESTSRFIGRSVGRLVGWSVGRLVVRLVGWSVGRSASWLVGWLVDQLVGQLVGHTFLWFLFIDLTAPAQML